MTATKPTVRTTDTAAMRALQQAHNYRVLANNAGWAVLNKANGEQYQVGLDLSCTCPHAKRLNGSALCKHAALTNLIELAKKPAPLSPAPRPMTAEQRRAAFFAPD
jgi:hypothetical protein